jgi:hypothetical protein
MQFNGAARLSSIRILKAASEIGIGKNLTTVVAKP